MIKEWVINVITTINARVMIVLWRWGLGLGLAAALKDRTFLRDHTFEDLFFLITESYDPLSGDLGWGFTFILWLRFCQTERISLILKLRFGKIEGSFLDILFIFIIYGALLMILMNQRRTNNMTRGVMGFWFLYMTTVKSTYNTILC